MFKRHRSFICSSAKKSEIFDVIAINCTSKYDIPGMIYNISSRYLTMPPTEENIKTAVWSSACRADLMERTYGTPPTADLKKTLELYNLNVDVNNCIYIPLDGSVLMATEKFIAFNMQSRR